MKASTAACMLLAASMAHAEGTSTVDGSWLLTYPSTYNNGTATATLVVSNGAGKWRNVAKTQGQGKNPCYGREFPVAVADADGSVVLEVSATSVMRGCDDLRIKVEMVDGTGPVGKFEDGRAVQFARQ
jgi:hypothetical protein